MQLLQVLRKSVKQQVARKPHHPLSEEAITLLSQQHHVAGTVISSLSQPLQKVWLRLPAIVCVSRHLLVVGFRMAPGQMPDARRLHVFDASSLHLQEAGTFSHQAVCHHCPPTP